MKFTRSFALMLALLLPLSLLCSCKAANGDDINTADSTVTEGHDESVPAASEPSDGTESTVSLPEAAISLPAATTSEEQKTESKPAESKPAESKPAVSKPETPKKPETESKTASSETVSDPDPAYLFMWTDDYLTAATHLRLQKKFLQLVNDERAANGRQPLTEDPDLDRIAAFRGSEVLEFFSHTRPNGTSWETAIPKSYPKRTAGENLTYTRKGTAASTLDLTDSVLDEIALKAFTDFKNSPSHYENMMLAEFTRTGICFNITRDDAGNGGSYFNYYCTNLFASVK